MTLPRRLIAPALLALTLTISVGACAPGEAVTGAATGVELTDAQRSSVAQHLVATARTSGEGAIAASFAATAIVAGAQVRIVSTQRLAALAGSIDRGNLAVGQAAGSYLAVATQVAERGSSDVLSIIVAWRTGPDGAPTDFVLTLAAGSQAASFTASEQSAPPAFGLIYAAPSAFWRATAGTTSLRRAATGEPCRNVDQRLAAAGLRATCRLALFDAAVEIASSERAVREPNTATGSAVFALGETRLGGVVIEVTGVVSAD